MQQSQNNKNNWTNVTTILFDDRLKFTILTLHEQNPNDCMLLLKSSNYLNILKGQDIIRKWFIENQQMFNITGHQLSLAPHHMPNFYALLYLNICDIQKCTSWNDVSHQIVDSKIIFCKLTTDSGMSNCACSHTVASENTYIIKHSITNFHILLGCDCGEKLGIMTKAKFNKMKKPSIYEQLQLNRKQQNKKNACIKNKSKQITKKWGLITNRLVTTVKNYRICCECKVRCIPIASCNWVIRCKPCYFSHKFKY